ncbi:MAG: hypothetical protein ACE5FO_01910 [Parvularculaceae bacterium]
MRHAPHRQHPKTQARRAQAADPRLFALVSLAALLGLLLLMNGAL